MSSRFQGQPPTSRFSAPAAFLCALAVTVCLLLVPQRACFVLGPARSLDTPAMTRRGGDATQRAPSSSGTPATAASHLAYEQSYGFFDDITDEDWSERQQRARSHQHYKKKASTKIGDDTQPNWWYMNNYYPLFTCPNQHRVGGSGDGPKWVCDPLRLKKKKKNATADKCLVYSVGCSGNYVFEDGLVDLLGAGTCEIHTFDLSKDFTRPGDAQDKDIHFHYWGLKSSYDPSGLQEKKFTYKTLPETMQELGHVNRTIDLFKIDCEGCEWTTYKDWISDDVDIRQLMIETHRLGDGKAATFFDDIQEAGYAMFSKEPNIFPVVAGRCVEWSFVKLAKGFFLGPTTDQR